MAPVTPLRSPPLRRTARGGMALLALTVLVIALSALAAPPPGAAYSCAAGEGRVPVGNRIDDCRKPVKAPKKSRRAKAEEAGRIGVTPLILLLVALGGTLALPIGFDRMSRREGYEPDQFLR
jgi:hypothetical protein